MSTKIDDEKIKAAKAKLACHIEPPKGSAFAEMLAKANEANGGDTEISAGSSAEVKTEDSCSTGGGVPIRDGRIRLTEMTTAGG